jgi:hypothetical protein
MNHCIGTHLDLRVDVGVGGVHDGDARGHELLVLVLSHNCAQFSEFIPGIDPSNFVRVVNHDGFHRQLSPAIQGNQVGEVVLALGVRGGDAS